VDVNTDVNTAFARC
jgi:hypothetical protein